MRQAAETDDADERAELLDEALEALDAPELALADEPVVEAIQVARDEAARALAETEEAVDDVELEDVDELEDDELD